MKTTNLGQIMPTIGRMDRRIVIQSYTAERDAAGGETLTWADFMTVSAALSYPATGSGEMYGKDQYQQIATRSVVFTVRYMAGVNEKMRVSYDDKLYDIESIAELGRKRYLELKCKLRD
jgi:SPP1 family predicted phage head-tail adaptor